MNWDGTSGGYDNGSLNRDACLSFIINSDDFVFIMNVMITPLSLTHSHTH